MILDNIVKADSNIKYAKISDSGKLVFAPLSLGIKVKYTSHWGDERTATIPTLNPSREEYISAGYREVLGNLEYFVPKEDTETKLHVEVLDGEYILVALYSVDPSTIETSYELVKDNNGDTTIESKLCVNISKLKNLDYICSGSKSSYMKKAIESGEFTFENVVSMNHAFENYSFSYYGTPINVTIDTSNCKSMYSAFYRSRNLRIHIDIIDISGVVNGDYAFYPDYATSYITIDNLVVGKSKPISELGNLMLGTNCTVNNITGTIRVNSDSRFSCYSKREALLIFNALEDNTGKPQYTLKIGYPLKLSDFTEEEIKIVTDKNIVLVNS
jgi:hypothetical protein